MSLLNHFALALALAMAFLPMQTHAEELDLTLRRRIPIADGRYGIQHTTAQWDTTRTAVIVCDMWDAHHCLNAVRRETQLAPRVDRFLKTLRNQGALIIHAPSDCMAAYEDHPARDRARQAPAASNIPTDISQWCDRIPEEEAGVYPLDQTDGGEDDDLEEHARWHEQLASQGRNPKLPWLQQIDSIEIDADRDAITDSGVEVWNLLEQHQIQQVMLVGVHTNMCVLGRPFGLRQMARNGRNVVLVRDLTDTMYNPQRWPYVSHFAGTDRIIEHIEKFVCPTITSDQILGDTEFRYAGDHRPHLVVLIGEDEYRAHETLPKFIDAELASTFRTSFLFERPDAPGDLLGHQELETADVLLVFMRRRALPTEQLEALQAALHRGIPVVGLRTASHAFALRDAPPAGRRAWNEFDAQVLGGNYQGHHGNHPPQDPATKLSIAPGAEDHPLLSGLNIAAWPASSWLYKTSPLAPGTTPLILGQVGDRPGVEPVAWTHIDRRGARVFYTSLGHPDEFELPEFRQFLVRGIVWAAGLKEPSEIPAPNGDRSSAH